MSPIKLTVHGTGEGACSLTGKDGKGLIVTFDDQTVVNSFLSWSSFKMLLGLKTKQQEKTVPAVKPAQPAGNGNPASAVAK